MPVTGPVAQGLSPSEKSDIRVETPKDDVSEVSTASGIRPNASTGSLQTTATGQAIPTTTTNPVSK